MKGQASLPSVTPQGAQHIQEIKTQGVSGGTHKMANTHIETIFEKTRVNDFTSVTQEHCGRANYKIQFSEAAFNCLT